jgi:hypothetical protein
LMLRTCSPWPGSMTTGAASLGHLASRRQAEGARWAPGTGIFLTTAGTV